VVNVTVLPSWSVMVVDEAAVLSGVFPQDASRPVNTTAARQNMANFLIMFFTFTPFKK